MRPSDTVVGLVEVTVVEPIWKVVLVVEENRQAPTPCTSTGQWANGARSAGSGLGARAAADPEVTTTSSDAEARATVAAHRATPRRRCPAPPDRADEKRADAV